MSWRLQFFTPPKASGPGYVKDGLVLWLDGIDNAGVGAHDPATTEWKDLTGLQTCTTPVGSPTWGADHCVFDGSSYFSFGDIGIKDRINADDATVEVVAYSDTPAGNMGVLAISSGTRGVWIYGDPTHLFGTASYRGTNNLVRLGAAGAISAMSLAGRGGYFNGAFVEDAAGVAAVTNAVTDIGRIQLAPVVFRLKGRIYSVRIYSRALTAEEIAANYEVDKERFNLP